MQLQLVVEPQERGVNFSFWDLGDRAVVLAAVVIPALPVGDPSAALFPEQSTAGAAVDPLVKRVFLSDAMAEHFFADSFQLLHRLKGCPVDDGRVRTRRIILFPFAVVFEPLHRKGVGGVSLLPEGIPNVLFIGEDV